MIKARLILSVLVMLVAISGTIAFNVTYFNGNNAYKVTNSYHTFNTVYSRFVPFCAPNLTVFITPNLPGFTTTVYKVTGESTLRLTLTKVGGQETITIPAWSCTLTTTLGTYVD